MHPGGAAEAAAGGAVMNVRAAARANIILGLAMAAMALVAATINPGDFHAQTIENAEQCAATEAEAHELRGTALSLVLTGVAQAAVAAAAVVASVGSLHGVDRCLTAAAHLIGAINACFLCYLVNRVAVVAVGHCSAGFFGDLAIGYAFVALSYAALLGVSAAGIFC